MRGRGHSSWTIGAITLQCAMVVCAMLSGTARGQTAGDNVDRLDKLAAPVHSLESARGFDRGRLSSVGRNLATFADRWSSARGSISLTASAGGNLDADLAGESHAASKLASQPTLGLSRYAGFTQSQTSTAWCGANVITAFNDTGSEIRTMGSSAGISIIGLSSSANHGGTFAYQGTPVPAASFYQSLLGAPVVACADEATFFYAAIWSDTQASVNGVALAKSTNVGLNFNPPTVVVSKSSRTDLVDHDWLAVDPNNHSAIYLAYADLDFSGTFCGRDPAAGSVSRATRSSWFIRVTVETHGARRRL
jgi:hypothetical protein